ncbi:polar growth protein [Thoreauomyces humboldtii]|nr:polar growth protein [Thoreauomyces humboldtii]
MVTDLHPLPSSSADFYELDLPFTVYGRHAFNAEEADEISFAAAEPIQVLERDELYSDGWWRGRNRQGVVGLFPKNFIVLDPPRTTSSSNHLGDDLSDRMSRTSVLSTSPPAFSKGLATLATRYSVVGSATSGDHHQNHADAGAADRAKDMKDVKDGQPKDEVEEEAGGLDRHPSLWTPRDVITWLIEEGLGHAVNVFKKDKINGAQLLELNLSSLRELGLESLGDRINILHAILALKEDHPAASPLPGPASVMKATPPRIATVTPPTVTASSPRPSLAAAQNRLASGGAPLISSPRSADSEQSQQDSGFVEMEDSRDFMNGRDKQYPTRDDSWNHQLQIPGSAAPAAELDFDPSRKLRKPASEFTLSDYFNEGNNNNNRDSDEGEDQRERMSLPAFMTNTFDPRSSEPCPVTSTRASHNNSIYGAPAGHSQHRHTLSSTHSLASTPSSPSTTATGDVSNTISAQRLTALKDLTATYPDPSPPSPPAGQKQHRRQRSLTLLNLRKGFRRASGGSEQGEGKRESVDGAGAEGGGAGGDPTADSGRFASPEHAGELEVRTGGEESGRWKRRWCVLEAGTLWILKDREHTAKPVAKILLSPSTTFTPLPATRARPYLLSVTHVPYAVGANPVTLVTETMFAARDQMSLVKWVDVLVREANGLGRGVVGLVPIRA